MLALLKITGDKAKIADDGLVSKAKLTVFQVTKDKTKVAVGTLSQNAKLAMLKIRSYCYNGHSGRNSGGD